MKPIVTIDFESHPIEYRPVYPPKPVGVSIMYGNDEPVYYAWGHPTDNTPNGYDLAVGELNYLWESAAAGQCELLFHNMKFDLSICYEYFGLPILPWDAVHDTQYLLFLDNPHSRTLELKPAAQALLGWAPEERDAINDWVFANRKELAKQYGVKISQQKGKVSKLYEWFCRAPGGLVGAYADGDVKRTKSLFDLLMPSILERGMGAAYDRLRKITPIIMENERNGIRVDMAALEADCVRYDAAFLTVEASLREYFGDPDLNFDADQDVASALSKSGVVDDDKWVLTPDGSFSVSKENLLPEMFNDPQVYQAMAYRNKLKTALSMFLHPWLRQGRARSGYVSTNWNITRGTGGGTRTGRMSSAGPNLLNVAKVFKEEEDGYQHPAFLELPELPVIRNYLIADEGHVWLNRDQDTQEFRVAAHVEGGALNEAYNANPTLDPHQYGADLILELTGRKMARSPVKNLSFLRIYGGGAPAAAKRLKVGVNEAREFIQLHKQAFPGIDDINKACESLVRDGLPVATWGGRVYYAEAPDKAYKIINVLCQGGAADLMNQTIIDWYYHPRRDPRVRWLLAVYDEISLSCPAEIADEQMEVLREVMEEDRLTVPMRSSGKRGPAWGLLEKCP